MKKHLAFVLSGIILITGLFTGCAGKKPENSLTILNYGKYLDPEVLEQFEEETGIHVDYEEYITPENMYTKYKAGAIDYDLICTSDYMVEKLIKEGQVLEMDFDNIPLSENLDPAYFTFSKSFDPENKYSMPYFFGTVGILYNKKMVDASRVDSWDILWDKEYDGKIIMPDSVRDAFMVALKRLGYSLNTTDETKLREAQRLLLDQKSMIYSYLVDEAQDEMIAENAAMAVVYSGEAGFSLDFNENLAFSVPKEGSNMWIDSWFMPKTCTRKENAEKFLNFLCREDISMQNFDYVYYATPNIRVFDDLEPELQENTTIFPTLETLDNCEILHSLDDSATTLFSELWLELKAYSE